MTVPQVILVSFGKQVRSVVLCDVHLAGRGVAGFLATFLFCRAAGRSPGVSEHVRLYEAEPLSRLDGDALRIERLRLLTGKKEQELTATGTVRLRPPPPGLPRLPQPIERTRQTKTRAIRPQGRRIVAALYH